MANAAELRKMLADAEETERAEEKARFAAWCAAKDAFIKTRPYAYEVKPREYKKFFSADETLQGVSVVRNVCAEKLAAFRAATPSTDSQIEHLLEQYQHGRGMFYYRTEENILTHEGGGTYVLKTPKLCNDAEWAEIVAGRIPTKFWY